MLLRCTRRQLMFGASATAIALPFLRMANARADAPAFPKRFIGYYFGSANIPEDWRPTGEGDSWDFGPLGAVLAPYKDKIVVTTGVDNQLPHLHATAKQDEHSIGNTSWLTGWEPDHALEFANAKGISVDQYLASRLGADMKFASLQFGSPFESYSSVCHAGPGQPLKHMTTPQEAFARLFGDFGQDPAAQSRRFAQRLSVLDLVRAEMGALRGELGSDGKYKLDAHLDSLRGLEKSLDPAYTVGSACEVPDASMFVPAPYYDTSEYWKIMDDMCNVMVAALKCDMTRIATLMMSPQGGYSHPESHGYDIPGDVASYTTFRAYAEKFTAFLANNLLQRLDAVEEGDGTMLDNCLVLSGTECSEPHAHSDNNMPIVLAGSAGGAIQTGRHLRFVEDAVYTQNRYAYAGVPHNNLLVSICNAMGLDDVTTFGNPEHCTGPLDGLVG